MGAAEKVMESASQRILLAAMGGRVEQRDFGTGPQIRDFDHIGGGGTTGVEVTSIQWGEQRAMWDAIAKSDRVAPDLSVSWVLHAPPGSSVKQIDKKAPGLLNALADGGVERFGYGDPVEDPDRAIEQLAELGVRRGVTLPSWSPPTLHLNDSTVGATGPSLIRKSIEEAANDEGNAKKLREADVDHRHLFVWIDHSHHAVRAAARIMSRVREMPPPVSVPPELDAVWLGLVGNCEGGFRASNLWRWADGQWEEVSHLVPPGPLVAPP